MYDQQAMTVYDSDDSIWNTIKLNMVLLLLYNKGVFDASFTNLNAFALVL
jgi:hypothetical protein